MQKLSLIFIIAALFSACSTDPVKESAEEKADSEIVELTPEQSKIAGIRVGKAELKEIHTAIKANGVAEAPPENIFSITFPIGGYIKQTRILPGMSIKKGALLAVIEDERIIELQQDYLMNKSKLEFAAADFERQKALNNTKANSDRVFQQAKSEYESQKILVKALSEKLKLIGINPTVVNENNITRAVRIHSPVDAFVSKVNVNPGKYITPTDILFELIKPSELHLTLTIFEKEASAIRAGQKVLCSTNTGGETIEATVYLVTPNLDENRTVAVRCKFQKFAGHIKPGTFMNAEIQLSGSKTAAVPDEAVVRWQNKHYVFVQQSGHSYKILEIEPGRAANGYTEIKSELKDEPIVIANAYTLLMKLKNSEEEG